MNDAPLLRTNVTQSDTPVRAAQLSSCPGTPDAVHTAAAQSPQRVVSKTALWSKKNVEGLHVEAGKFAMGVPQPDPGLGEPSSMSLGTEPRAKNQVVMPSSSQSAVGGIVRRRNR